MTVMILSSMSLALKTAVQPAWQKVPSSVGESGVISLSVFPVENSSAILAGTQQAVYRSMDEGKTFRPILQLPSSEKRINYLYISYSRLSFPNALVGNPIIRPPTETFGGDSQFSTEPSIFAATNSGLFVSQDQGLRWEKIFSSADPLTRHCLSVVVDRGTIYLGTENGLFYQKLGESSWHRRMDFLTPGLSGQAISFLAQDSRYIYVSTSHELFQIDKDGGNVQKIFSLISREEEAEISADPAEPSTASQIKQIEVFNEEAPYLYLATTKGVFKSLDQGGTWINLNSDELPVSQITSLVVLPDQDIWVGTLKGVFRYHDERWLPLYKGIETNRVNFLTLDEEARVYAATDQGIFFMDGLSFPNALVGNPDKVMTGPPTKKFGGDNFRDRSYLQKIFQHEPSIHQVHEMAIRYAEVHPQKIASWRSAARKRGLMPKLSTGLNRSATDMFHWDTGPNPDVLTKGRDFLDWNVSLSWDFGDLIWNSDQTSIDSRSKLMVELREDILDQITRLYFERRRIQFELAEFESKELSESSGRRFESEKEMRLEELTALIDALTGGEFSRRIEEDQKGER